MTSDELLTTKEVEKLIQLNRVTIYRLIREENLPAVKVCGQWRFPRQQVQAWLDARQRTSDPPPDPPAPPAHLAPRDPGGPQALFAGIFNGIEMTSLLTAFATSLGLSVYVINAEGETLVECPTCCHPFCQYVRDASSGRDICEAVRSSATLQAASDSSGTHLLRCASGLRYLQAPVASGEQVLAHVLMGPVLTEHDHDSDVLPTLDAFARSTGADHEVLLQHYRTLQRFSLDQIYILVDLLSQVVSTMLRVVSSRYDAEKRLDEIAQLAADRQP